MCYALAALEFKNLVLLIWYNILCTYTLRPMIALVMFSRSYIYSDSRYLNCNKNKTSKRVFRGFSDSIFLPIWRLKLYIKDKGLTG